MNLTDRVVVLTGASGGIGSSTARHLIQKGAQVALSDLSGPALEQLAEELGDKVQVFPADMTLQEDVERLIHDVHQKYGRIDILINNAGQAAGGLIGQIDPEQFRHIMNLNVFGPLFAMQAVAPLMKKAGGGVIVNVSSDIIRMYVPGLAAYTATKSALTVLSKAATQELLPDHIKVITFYPSRTATSFGLNALLPKGVSMPGDPAMWSKQKGDDPKFVAERIITAIEEEKSEVSLTTK